MSENEIITITITKSELVQLATEKEQIRILKRLLTDFEYVSVGEIRAVLGVPEKPRVKAVQDGTV